MVSQTTMYITLVGLSGAFNLFFCYYVFSRRSEIPAYRTYILYTLVLSIYSFGYAFELASDTIEQVKVWTRIEYIGIATFAPLGLVIIHQYLGREISGFIKIPLFFIPAITFIMVITSDYHDLFYKVFEFKEGVSPHILYIEIGKWYIVQDTYMFCCTVAGILLLLSRWKQTQRAYRLQLITLICGLLIPMIAGFSYRFGVTPTGLDPVPISLCITSALYIWATMSTKMLTVIPIAKETIFDSMEEGFIVLDLSDRLIDYNRAVSRMIPALNPCTIGKNLYQSWAELTSAPVPFNHHLDQNIEEFNWADGASKEVYEVRSSAMRNRNGVVVGKLLMFINVTELKRLQQELEQRAHYDGLTQIFNRSEFIHRGRELLERSRVNQNPFSVILLDIDYFKRVNDNFGHETGDKLLIHVAAICQAMLPEGGLFARYGGEEFVLALSSPLREASELSERLRATLENTPLNTSKGTVGVTSSFGVVEATHRLDETLEVLLRKADEALYRAKREGRNRISIANSP
ncbi:histidine kinase N-terminal 7TM domain-containing diguanylate cyclase [Cohnella abietis]|uniref:GGDEF domain-containing protein n=1 Tax=Cohnella abietis TaxID=2507935 RepID=A0A3T1CYM7_9BACL|nr:histidine kinase N-terminal 7TM domain-containing protein [Cohnella abietis]BBI30911.1 GGDEF domain-containing protein [Cohnella abietis]